MSPTPLSKTKIETKLATIRESLFELQKLGQETREKFIKDKHNFALAEHYLRRSLEATFDIANHVISRFPYSPGQRPDTLKGIAKALGEKDIIEKKFANETLTKMAGYRNRMIHFYLELTTQELYDIIRHKLGDFEIFARAIVELLENPEKFDLTVSE